MAPSPATARRPEPLTDPEAGELIARRLAAQLAAIGPAAVAAPGEVSPGTGALPALADQRVAARVRVELPRYADGVAASAAAEERALSTERVAAAESAEANEARARVVDAPFPGARWVGGIWLRIAAAAVLTGIEVVFSKPAITVVTGGAKLMGSVRLDDAMALLMGLTLWVVAEAAAACFGEPRTVRGPGRLARVRAALGSRPMVGVLLVVLVTVGLVWMAAVREHNAGIANDLKAAGDAPLVTGGPIGGIGGSSEPAAGPFGGGAPSGPPQEAETPALGFVGVLSIVAFLAAVAMAFAANRAHAHCESARIARRAERRARRARRDGEHDVVGRPRASRELDRASRQIVSIVDEEYARLRRWLETVRVEYAVQCTQRGLAPQTLTLPAVPDVGATAERLLGFTLPVAVQPVGLRPTVAAEPDPVPTPPVSDPPPPPPIDVAEAPVPPADVYGAVGDLVSELRGDAAPARKGRGRFRRRRHTPNAEEGVSA